MVAFRQTVCFFEPAAKEQVVKQQAPERQLLIRAETPELIVTGEELDNLGKIGKHCLAVLQNVVEQIKLKRGGKGPQPFRIERLC
ncbi:MAG: hypothetical protein ACD_75C02418G0005 [uncultured bacterium]|nr:MAG: hypothetical protein ACD_75C02418G0005 [uncultured bacterium]